MAASARVVGIIGGMGPEATVELMRRVVARTPAQDDQDHVHLLVDNNPHIPSRIRHLIDRVGPDPTAELVRMAKGLEVMGANSLAIPCNTAHAYADAIRRAVRIPLLDMVELTAQHIAAKHPGARVGLLASTAVTLTGLYHRAFAACHCQLVLPGEQAQLMEVIRDVKRGSVTVAAREQFARIAASLARQSDLLLIACTELSLLAAAVPEGTVVIDSMDVLTEAIVAFALEA